MTRMAETFFAAYTWVTVSVLWPRIARAGSGTAIKLRKTAGMKPESQPSGLAAGCRERTEAEVADVHVGRGANGCAPDPIRRIVLLLSLCVGRVPFL